MLYDPREFRRSRNRILLVSALAWVWLISSALLSSGSPSHMAAHSSHAMPAGPAVTNAGAAMAIGWSFMLVAMMAPTLIIPLWYIHVRSLARRRLRSSALFVFGYVVVWMTIGALVLGADMGFRILQTQSLWPAATLAMIALVWQTSPAKQRCLNRCHAHRSFAAFGTSADVDVFRFGISHGVWCVGSCWALMLFPMLLPRGHVAAMAAVAVIMFSERLENPARPAWRFRGLGKAKRIVLAQTRSSWQRFSAVPGKIS